MRRLEAAAAAAAHRILSNYFPAQAAALDAHLAASLAPIPRQQAKGAGHRLRRGRGQPHHRAPHQRRSARDGGHPTGSGGRRLGAHADWRSRPSPGRHGSAGCRPLALDSYDTFDPGDPPAIDSATYVEEYNRGQVPREVRQHRADCGADPDGSVLLGRRHRPDAGGLRKLATDRGLDISDSARLFAAVETSIADTAGTVWNAKLQYMWWRPVTAIQKGDTDGNDATVGDATWLPFIATRGVSRLAERPVRGGRLRDHRAHSDPRDGRPDDHVGRPRVRPGTLRSRTTWPDPPSMRGCGPGSTCGPPTRCRSTSARASRTTVLDRYFAPAH